MIAERAAVTVTVTDEHWERAIQSVIESARQARPVVVALCCPLFQALREKLPDTYLLVGRQRVHIGHGNQYSCDERGGMIVYSFTETEWAKPFPLPVDVTLTPRSNP